MKNVATIGDSKFEGYRLAASIKLKGVDAPERRKRIADWLREKAEDVENTPEEEWDKNISFTYSWK